MPRRRRRLASSRHRQQRALRRARREGSPGREAGRTRPARLHAGRADPHPQERRLVGADAGRTAPRVRGAVAAHRHRPALLASVARRLHHCRDLGPDEPFDFLTWFEFRAGRRRRLRGPGRHAARFAGMAFRRTRSRHPPLPLTAFLHENSRCVRCHYRDVRRAPRRTGAGTCRSSSRPAAGSSRCAEARHRGRRRRHARDDAADDRHGLQLRRARLPGSRDVEVPDRRPRAARLHRRARRRRHADGVDGALGIGQAGDRARLGHRRHPAGVAEARRRLPRPDRRRRARATAKGTTPACRCKSPRRSR